MPDNPHEGDPKEAVGVGDRVDGEVRWRVVRPRHRVTQSMPDGERHGWRRGDEVPTARSRDRTGVPCGRGYRVWRHSIAGQAWLPGGRIGYAGLPWRHDLGGPSGVLPPKGGRPADPAGRGHAVGRVPAPHGAFRRARGARAVCGALAQGCWRGALPSLWAALFRGFLLAGNDAAEWALGQNHSPLAARAVGPGPRGRASRRATVMQGAAPAVPVDPVAPPMTTRGAPWAR